MAFMDGYKQYTDAVAYSTIAKPIYMPDARLAVGSAQDMSPVHLRQVWVNHANKIVLPDVHDIPVEQAILGLDTPTISPQDFPTGSPGLWGTALGEGGY